MRNNARPRAWFWVGEVMTEHHGLTVLSLDL